MNLCIVALNTCILAETARRLLAVTLPLPEEWRLAESSRTAIMIVPNLLRHSWQAMAARFRVGSITATLKLHLPAVWLSTTVATHSEKSIKTGELEEVRWLDIAEHPPSHPVFVAKTTGKEWRMSGPQS
jgi:hypothetical protein